MDLQARFQRALAAAGATDAGSALYQELVDRHREPHRHYHTLAHIDACLAWLDWFAGAAEHPHEVELALWFHDAIYTPGAPDNEHRSAALARDRLAALGVPPAAIDRITRAIEATEHHTAAPGDASLVVDLDLTILGAPPATYDRFEHHIRQEYAHVPQPLYTAARRQVLTAFLSRPHIYRLPAIRHELETKARANLQRRIAEQTT